MEVVVLLRVGILGLFLVLNRVSFKPSDAPLYPNTGQVPLPKNITFRGNR